MLSPRAALGHNGSMRNARTNVADRLATIAARMPDAVAVARPGGDDLAGENRYSTCTFSELDADATALARGLVELGVQPSDRLVLLVPPGVEFVKLVFGLLRSGATTVLVDPGMGRKHLVNCLAATEPDGFVAIGRAHAVRTVLRRRFPLARFNVTVGRRWFWGGLTYRCLLKRGRDSSAVLPATQADDPAAIIFTSGSTGPPKGVLYTHRMFEAQVAEIQRAYDLQPGGFDLACFALFGLFNSAMGVTTVFPDMDFSRPASADPRKLLAAATDWRVTQAFASPAVWDKLSRYCERTGEMIPTLRKVFSCGAPVPADVLRRTLACVHAHAEMHTPYGATEALPVSTIEAREVLGETAARTAAGAGVCVGHKFDGIDWRVIRISDEPIANLDAAQKLPHGEIGELIVRGPQVSNTYLPLPSLRRGGLGMGDGAGYPLQPPSPTLPSKGREPEDSEKANALAKIADLETVWHRMGDAGYLDAENRFWYCGRKSHRVITPQRVYYTECCESVFNAAYRQPRTALVGVGPHGRQTPVIIISLYDVWRESLPLKVVRICWELEVDYCRQRCEANVATRGITTVLKYPQRLPVDVRHNAKINREVLARWAATRVRESKSHGAAAGGEDAPAP